MQEISSANPTDFANRVLRNTAILTAGGVAMQCVNLVWGLYTIRVLGHADYGRYAAVLAFVGLFGIFFELGMTQYVERTIAQDRTRARELVVNLVALRLLLALAGIAVLGTVAGFLNYDRVIVYAIVLHTATFVPAALLVPIDAVLTAHERFDWLTVAELLCQVLHLLVSMALLALGYGFLALIYAGFVSMGVQIVLFVLALRRIEPALLRVRPSLGQWPALIRGGLPFGMTTLALTFSFGVDSVLLSLMFSSSMVGWYNAAYRFVFAAVGLAEGFLEAMTPALAREHVSNPQRVQGWVRQSIGIAAVAALPIAVGGAVLAPQVVDLLYGQEYAPAAPVLVVIAWDIPLLLLNAFAGNVSAATGLEARAARIYGLSAVLNIALNLIAIPLWGMLGAAVVTLVTDALSAWRFQALFRHELGISMPVPLLARIAAASGVLGVTLWLLSELPVLLVAVIGGLVYLGVSCALRTIDLGLVLSRIRGLRRSTV